MNSERFDVTVVGAGPAGATLALLLARKEHRIALIDRERFPRSEGSLSWLSSRAVPLLGELEIPTKSWLSAAFTDVTFHNADFSKSAKPNLSAAPGYLIDRALLDNALVETASAQGISQFHGVAATELALKENHVAVVLADGRRIESRLLVLAAGRDAGLTDRVGVSRGRAGSVVWSAQVELPSPKESAAKTPRVGVVFGLDKRGSFGLYYVSRDRTSASVNWYGDRAQAVPALVALCQGALALGAIPVDLKARAAYATTSRCPVGAALDMDTHVGKHTLVIGDAGGFIAAASHEGIYPAMWSAQIAAAVADAALGSVHSQDELMTFDTAWRTRMADYLRPPNTDTQFLLPLVFSNQPMADRMASAFFSGENL